MPWLRKCSTSAGLGEDQGLARGAEVIELREGAPQRGEQGLALGIVADALGQLLVAAQLADFLRDGCAVLRAQRRIGVARAVAFVICLVQRFEVLAYAIRQALGFGRLGEQPLQPRGHGTERAADGMGAGGEQLPQHQRDQLPLAVGQGLEIRAP